MTPSHAGVTIARARPTPHPAGFRALSAGAQHSCGLRTDGTVECWGASFEGEADAPGGAFRAVSAGGIHSCGLRTDGTLECWGAASAWKPGIPAGMFEDR